MILMVLLRIYCLFVFIQNKKAKLSMLVVSKVNGITNQETKNVYKLGEDALCLKGSIILFTKTR